MKNTKKILGALLVHDNRAETLPVVLSYAKKLNIDLKLFAFSDQEVSKECDCVFDRPEPEMDKISCSYLNLGTGMRETELMQLSWLRNKALEVAQDYDAILFIDSDVALPEDTVERLLKCNSDIAMGWYFHKRLGVPAINYIDYSPDKIDDDMKSKKIVDGISGGNGCVLMKRNVYEKLRYDLYNGTMAEDTAFYKKAKEEFSIKIDLGLYCEHLGDDWKPKALEFKKIKSELWSV